MNFDDMADPPIEDAVKVIMSDAEELLGDLRIYDATLARLRREMAVLLERMRAGIIEGASADGERERIRSECEAANQRFLERHAE